MTTLIDKAKSGSLLTKQDLRDALKWTIGRQPFDTFYKGLFDDYIAGVPATEIAKRRLAIEVDEELEILFAPIFALLPRLNKSRGSQK